MPRYFQNTEKDRLSRLIIRILIYLFLLPPLSGEQSDLFEYEKLISLLEEKMNFFLEKSDFQKERMALERVKVYLQEIEQKMNWEEGLRVEEGFDWWETNYSDSDLEEEEWEIFSD